MINTHGPYAAAARWPWEWQLWQQNKFECWSRLINNFVNCSTWPSLQWNPVSWKAVADYSLTFPSNELGLPLPHYAVGWKTTRCNWWWEWRVALIFYRQSQAKANWKIQLQLNLQHHVLRDAEWSQTKLNMVDKSTEPNERKHAERSFGAGHW